MSEYSHRQAPSQPNHSAVACGPSGPMVATRQVCSAARNASISAADIAILRPRFCGFSSLIVRSLSTGPGLAGQGGLGPDNAELVALGVGQEGPGLAAGLADVHAAST